MILRLVTSAELVNDDGTTLSPRAGFKVGSAVPFLNPEEIEPAMARLLSEIMVETMAEGNKRWAKNRDIEKQDKK